MSIAAALLFMPTFPVLILASNSPRRRDLLQQVGFPFEVDPAGIDESVLPGETPEAYAVRAALDKARVVAARHGSGLVIGADTIVVAGGGILGKPVDRADAERMLGMLSGREHRVITGLAVIDAASRRERSGAAATRVWFRRIDPAELAAYAASGEPLDKAGAYGIQEKGALFIDRIDGCYFNVVGLPLALLGGMLKEFGVAII